MTNAVCSPSRASILTGTHSHVNGVTTLSTPIDASQPTFVSLLREAGYRTAVVGRWHLGHGAGHDPEGFDHWEVLIDQGNDGLGLPGTGAATQPPEWELYDLHDVPTSCTTPALPRRGRTSRGGAVACAGGRRRRAAPRAAGARGRPLRG